MAEIKYTTENTAENQISSKSFIPGNANLLRQIQDWYLRQCDGEWQHFYGISIDTVVSQGDQLGWKIEIDLKDTDLEYQNFQIVKIISADLNDWLECNVLKNKFIGRADLSKLEMLLSVFLDWVADFNAVTIQGSSKN